MKNIQKFFISFRLVPQRAVNGEQPIYVRLYIDSKRTELSTRLYIQPRYWDSKKFEAKPGYKDADFINMKLADIKAELRREFLLMASHSAMVNINDLKNKYLNVGEKPTCKTLCEAFDYHNAKIEQLVKVGKLSDETLERYWITKKKIVGFMNHVYKVSDKPLKDLKLSFITDLEHYFLTVQKLHSNTIYKYIKNLKKIIGCAVDADWLPKSPFNGFKCRYVWKERDVLTQEEINTLWNAEIKIQRLAEVRDVFIFCCYTGLAYIDVYNFEYDAVLKGLDGEYWLKALRQKTKVKESVPLLPIPIEIISRYRNHSYCVEHNKLLPINTNQRYNAYLKELADVCGIKKHLTTHLARHTFATTITLSNGVPIETVSSMLGHKNIKTTQIYAKVVEKKVSEDMKVLKQKLIRIGSAEMSNEAAG
jgi:integrase